MPLEHTTLKLTREAVKEQEEKEEHDSRPSRADLIAIDIVTELQIVRRRHEHGNPRTDHKGDEVVVLRVCRGV